MNGADVKLATVDMGRILQAYPAMEKAKASLKEQVKEIEDEKASLVEGLEKKKDEFENARKEAMNKALSEEQKEKHQKNAEDLFRELREKELQIRKILEARQKEIADQEARMLKKILTEIKAIIAEYARKKDYTVVLDTGSFGVSGLNIVLFAEEKIDITEQILKIIEKGQ